jgi:Translation initiation factor IF-3, N-terminal domain
MIPRQILRGFGRLGGPPVALAVRHLLPVACSQSISLDAPLSRRFASMRGSGKTASRNQGRSGVLGEAGEEDDDTDDEDDDDYEDAASSDDRTLGADKGKGDRLLKPRSANRAGGKTDKIVRTAKPPCNWEIRSIAPQIRVVDGDSGENLGVMSVAKGVELAQSRGSDLVLIAAMATPPVAKITPLHKITAALKQAEADKRKAARMTKTKEMRFTARISGELSL